MSIKYCFLLGTGQRKTDDIKDLS